MGQYTADNIKNIALAGHGNGGKTSLAEALLYLTKGTVRHGKIAEGSTVLDFEKEEVKRTASISTSMASVEYQGVKMNLIDTPGQFDFVAGLHEGLRACESVLIPISGKSGVSVGVRKVMQYASDYNKATMMFVGKLDSETADFFKVYNELKETFGPRICPVVIPHIENLKVKCYIDVITMKAFEFDKEGKSTPVEIPNSPILDELREGIKEAVAESSDEYMEKYFAGEEFTSEEIILGLYNGTIEGRITPVFCGSSEKLYGMAMFLYGMSRLLPNAVEGTKEIATLNGESVEVSINANERFSSFVFKTIVDPFIGRMSFVKVISGELTSKTELYNPRIDKIERMNKIVFLKGKEQIDTDKIVAGDIGVITRLDETKTGDSLCDISRKIVYKGVNYPKPTLSMAIEILKKGDESKISDAINKVMEEDPTIHYHHDPSIRQQILTGIGDQHLDVAVNKLSEKYGVSVGLIPSKIAYRETIRKPLEVRGRHKKQSGGSGQFGDVIIEFSPSNEEGLDFSEKVFGGSVPRNYFPAVEDGIRESMQKGILAGFPMQGLKAVLKDGSYHAVDSNEMSFKLAASLAFRTAMPDAKPALLEPVYTYTITVPDDFTGDIISEVNKRRGRILGMEPNSHGDQVVHAQIPEFEMKDFTTTLRSITAGAGGFEFEFNSYELVPDNLQDKIIADAKSAEE